MQDRESSEIRDALPEICEALRKRMDPCGIAAVLGELLIEGYSECTVTGLETGDWRPLVAWAQAVIRQQAGDRDVFRFFGIAPTFFSDALCELDAICFQTLSAYAGACRDISRMCEGGTASEALSRA